MIFPKGGDGDDDDGDYQYCDWDYVFDDDVDGNYDDDDEGDCDQDDELLLFWCGQGLPLMLMWRGGLQNMERWPRYQISYFLKLFSFFNFQRQNITEMYSSDVTLFLFLNPNSIHHLSALGYQLFQNMENVRHFPIQILNVSMRLSWWWFGVG